MDNDLYVDRNVADRMEHFTEAETSQLLDRLESIRIEPLENSEPFPNAPDLRIAEAGPHRIIFTYRPEDSIVMVTDVDEIQTGQQHAYSRAAVTA